jgi:hypothetical protein
MRKLIISLITAAATAATAGPALAQPPNPCRAPAHVGASATRGYVVRQPDPGGCSGHRKPA